MRISVSEAKAQLTELVRRAESGEEVVLTRHGQDVAQNRGSSETSARPRRTPRHSRGGALWRL